MHTRPVDKQPGAVVVMDTVAIGGSQVQAAHPGHAGAVDDVHAEPVVAGFIAQDLAVARAAEVDAPALGIAMGQVVGKDIDAARDVDADVAVPVSQAVGDAGKVATHRDAITGVAVGRQVVQRTKRRRAVDGNAVLVVPPGGDPGALECVGPIAHIQAAVGIAQRQMPHGHEIGVVELDQRPRAVAGDRREQRGGDGAVVRPAEQETLVQAQPRVDAARQQHRIDHRVVAGVDQQAGEAVQRVLAQHVDRVGLGRIGRLAGVAVGAGGAGRVVVAGIAGVVDVVGAAVLGHREALLAAVEHGQVVHQRDLDAQAVGAEVDAAIAGNPDELAVVGGAAGDVEHESRAVRAVLHQVDAHRRARGVVDRLPADGERLELLPVGVHVGEAQQDAGVAAGSRLVRGMAVGAEVGHIGLGHRDQEGLVQPGVVAGAAVAVRGEAQHGKPRTGGHQRAATHELPAVGGVEGRCADTGAAAAQGDGVARGVEELQRHHRTVGGCFSGAAGTPAEDHVEVARVELCGREAGGQQVHRLLHLAFLDVARVEVLAAFERRRAAGLDAGAGVGAPAGEAGLETGVHQQVAVMRRHRLVEPRIGRLDIRAGEAQPGRGREQPEVVAVGVQELRLGPQRVDHGRADGMQVEAGDVGLPVQHIGEIARPVTDAAALVGIQVVVVAEETGLRIVGDIDVVPRARPQDVAAHLDIAGAGLHADVVARRRIEGVLVDAHIRHARHEHARAGVAVDQVVGHQQAVGGGNAGAVAGDAAVLHRAGEAAHALAIGLNAVGQVERAAAHDAAAADAGAVVAQPLVLELRTDRLQAGGVAIDLVHAGAGREAQALGGARHGGADTGGIAPDAVVAQVGRGPVVDADAGAVDVVVVDAAREGRVDVQRTGQAVPGDGPAAGRLHLQARAAELVVHDAQVLPAAQHQLAGEETRVTQREAVRCVAGGDVGVEHQALQRHVGRGDHHRPVDLRRLARRADDGDAGVARRHGEAVEAARTELDHVAGVQIDAGQDVLQLRAVGRRVHVAGRRHARAQVDRGHGRVAAEAAVGLAPGDQRQARRARTDRHAGEAPAGLAEAVAIGVGGHAGHEAGAIPDLGIQGLRLVRAPGVLVGPEQPQGTAARGQPCITCNGGVVGGRAVRGEGAQVGPGCAVEGAALQVLVTIEHALPDHDQAAIHIGQRRRAVVTGAGRQALGTAGARQVLPDRAVELAHIDLVVVARQAGPGHRDAGAVGGQREVGGIGRRGRDSGAAGRPQGQPVAAVEAACVDLVHATGVVQPDRHQTGGGMDQAHLVGLPGAAQATGAERTAQGHPGTGAGVGAGIEAGRAHVGQAAGAGLDPGHHRAAIGREGQRGLARAAGRGTDATALRAAAQHLPGTAVVAQHIDLEIAVAGIGPGQHRPAQGIGRDAGFERQRATPRQATAAGRSAQCAPQAADIRTVGQAGQRQRVAAGDHRRGRQACQGRREIAHGPDFTGAEIHHVRRATARLGLVDAIAGAPHQVDAVIAAFAVQQVVATLAEELVGARAGLVAVGAEVAVQPVGIQPGAVGLEVPVEHVVLRAAKQHVGASAALEQVVAGLPFEDVVALVAQQAVMAAIAVETVATTAAVHRVRTIIRAAQHVVVGTTAQHVAGAAPAQELVLARLAVDLVGIQPAVDHVAVVTAVQRVLPETALDAVHAGLAVYEVAMLAATDLVVAGATLDDVGAPQAPDAVIALAAEDAVAQVDRVEQVAVVAATVGADDDVVAVVALQDLAQAHTGQQHVVVVAAGQRIRALAAVQQVLAGIAVQGIGARFAHQVVVVLVARQDIVAAAAVEAVAPGVALQQVGARFAVELVIAAAAEQLVVVVAAVQAVRMFATHHQVDAVAAEDQIFARVAVQQVVAGLAVDAVVVFLATHRVIATTAQDQVLAGAAQDGVVAGVAVQLVGLAVTVQRVLVSAAMDDVDAAAAADEVVAGIAVEAVGTGATEDLVIATAAEGLVIAVLPGDVVVAELPIERVVAAGAAHAVVGADMAGAEVAEQQVAGAVVGTEADTETIQRVGIGAAVEPVLAGIAHQDVVALLTVEQVHVDAAHEAVVADTTEEVVLAHATKQRIVARAAVELVGAALAEQLVVAAAALDIVGCAVVPGAAFAVAVDAVIGAAALEHVLAGAALDEGGTATGHDDVLATAAHQLDRVQHAGVDVDHVIAVAAVAHDAGHRRMARLAGLDILQGAVDLCEAEGLDLHRVRAQRLDAEGLVAVGQVAVQPVGRTVAHVQAQRAVGVVQRGQDRRWRIAVDGEAHQRDARDLEREGDADAHQAEVQAEAHLELQVGTELALEIEDAQRPAHLDAVQELAEAHLAVVVGVVQVQAQLGVDTAFDLDREDHRAHAHTGADVRLQEQLGQVLPLAAHVVGVGHVEAVQQQAGVGVALLHRLGEGAQALGVVPETEAHTGTQAAFQRDEHRRRRIDRPEGLLDVEADTELGHVVAEDVHVLAQQQLEGQRRVIEQREGEAGAGRALDVFLGRLEARRLGGELVRQGLARGGLAAVEVQAAEVDAAAVAQVLCAAEIVEVEAAELDVGRLAQRIEPVQEIDQLACRLHEVGGLRRHQLGRQVAGHLDEAHVVAGDVGDDGHRRIEHVQDRTDRLQDGVDRVHDRAHDVGQELAQVQPHVVETHVLQVAGEAVERVEGPQQVEVGLELRETRLEELRAGHVVAGAHHTEREVQVGLGLEIQVDVHHLREVHPASQLVEGQPVVAAHRVLQVDRETAAEVGRVGIVVLDLEPQETQRAADGHVRCRGLHLDEQLARCRGVDVDAVGAAHAQAQLQPVGEGHLHRAVVAGLQAQAGQADVEADRHRGGVGLAQLHVELDLIHVAGGPGAHDADVVGIDHAVVVEVQDDVEVPQAIAQHVEQDVLDHRGALVATREGRLQTRHDLGAQVGDEVGRVLEVVAHDGQVDAPDLAVHRVLDAGQHQVDAVDQAAQVAEQVDRADLGGQVGGCQRGAARDVAQVGDVQRDVAREVRLGGEIHRQRGRGLPGQRGVEDRRRPLVAVVLVAADRLEAHGEGSRTDTVAQIDHAVADEQAQRADRGVEIEIAADHAQVQPQLGVVMDVGPRAGRVREVETEHQVHARAAGDRQVGAAAHVDQAAHAGQVGHTPGHIPDQLRQVQVHVHVLELGGQRLAQVQREAQVVAGEAHHQIRRRQAESLLDARLQGLQVLHPQRLQVVDVGAEARHEGQQVGDALVDDGQIEVQEREALDVAQVGHDLVEGAEHVGQVQVLVVGECRQVRKGHVQRGRVEHVAHAHRNARVRSQRQQAALHLDRQVGAGRAVGRDAGPGGDVGDGVEEVADADRRRGGGRVADGGHDRGVRAGGAVHDVHANEADVGAGIDVRRAHGGMAGDLHVAHESLRDRRGGVGQNFVQAQLGLGGVGQRVRHEHADARAEHVAGGLELQLVGHQRGGHAAQAGVGKGRVDVGDELRAGGVGGLPCHRDGDRCHAIERHLEHRVGRQHPVGRQHQATEHHRLEGRQVKAQRELQPAVGRHADIAAAADAAQRVEVEVEAHRQRLVGEAVVEPEEEGQLVGAGVVTRRDGAGRQAQQRREPVGELLRVAEVGHAFGILQVVVDHLGQRGRKAQQVLELGAVGEGHILAEHAGRAADVFQPLGHAVHGRIDREGRQAAEVADLGRVGAGEVGGDACERIAGDRHLHRPGVEAAQGRDGDGQARIHRGGGAVERDQRGERGALQFTQREHASRIGIGIGQLDLQVGIQAEAAVGHAGTEKADVGREVQAGGMDVAGEPEVVHLQEERVVDRQARGEVDAEREVQVHAGREVQRTALRGDGHAIGRLRNGQVHAVQRAAGVEHQVETDLVAVLVAAHGRQARNAGQRTHQTVGGLGAAAQQVVLHRVDQLGLQPAGQVGRLPQGRADDGQLLAELLVGGQGGGPVLELVHAALQGLGQLGGDVGGQQQAWFEALEMDALVGGRPAGAVGRVRGRHGAAAVQQPLEQRGHNAHVDSPAGPCSAGTARPRGVVLVVHAGARAVARRHLAARFCALGGFSGQPEAEFMPV